MEADRIKFLGNPWPKGHAIQDFLWSARLERSGIWFDLHLQTTNYDAEDSDTDEEIDDEELDESLCDWQSKSAWTNYHQCTLSSNYWDGTEFHVASKAQPLDFKTLSGHEFFVDPLPIDFDRPRPFDIYLLGHDSAADHRIRFTQRSPANHFSIDWRGRIALSYIGSYEFRYEFEAHVESTEFKGIELPKGTQEQDAQQLLAPFVTNLDAFNLVVRGGERWFELK